MHLKRISRWVMVSGVLLIWAIKFLVRPFVFIPSSLKVFIGIAPNLIGSFLIPFGACLFFKKIFRLQNQRDLAVTCLVGLLLVIINEYLQLIPFFGRTFDYLDILASVIGVLAGQLVFSRIMREKSAGLPSNLELE